MKFRWSFPSMKFECSLPSPEEIFGDRLQSLECHICGAIHNQERFHYEDGEGFSLDISVDLCPRDVR